MQIKNIICCRRKEKFEGTIMSIPWTNYNLILKKEYLKNKVRLFLLTVKLQYK